MFCNNCGKEIPDGSAKCPDCGAEIKKEQQPIKKETAMGFLEKLFGSYSEKELKRIRHLRRHPLCTVRLSLTSLNRS